MTEEIPTTSEEYLFRLVFDHQQHFLKASKETDDERLREDSKAVSEVFHSILMNYESFRDMMDEPAQIKKLKRRHGSKQ